MIIATYKNGNTEVTLFDDGTKVRKINGEKAKVFFPESIDIKITNYCDLGCQYCHETSTTKGLHGDLDKLIDVLVSIPRGVEIAIGGGNPLAHPNLLNFLKQVKAKGLIANLTINQGHLGKYKNLIHQIIQEDLIKGIGISITSNNFKYIKELLEINDHIVFHIIAGINTIQTIDTLKQLTNKKIKVLILGYKQFGFGIDFYSKEIENNIQQWYRGIYNFIGQCILSFDNLAIEQLNIKRLFTQQGWNKFYMGDDYTHSMYIDAIEQKYAPTSRSNNRVKFENMSLRDFFLLGK